MLCCLIFLVMEWDILFVLLESQDDMICYYIFNDFDLLLICQWCGDVNCLGFVVQFSLLCYFGYVLGIDSELFELVILWVVKQVQVDLVSWVKYGECDVICCEYVYELCIYL